MPLLTVEDLKTSFHTREGITAAVNGVSFRIEHGETLGIVGESGSGKSVGCYSLVDLIPRPPGKIESGKAIFDNTTDLLSCSHSTLQGIRGKRIAMIFQDPMTSLNPYMRIGDQLIEPLLIHFDMKRKQAIRKGIEALEEVGIHDAENRMRSFPHEFSGGMRQRVMIAMALITEPDLLIADEPTTALDVTVQAQILELIQREQENLGMAVILISHDLAVVSGFCDRVNIMYAGRIFETGPTEEIFYNPQHPYNRALQKSIPGLQAKGEELYTIKGMPPDLSKRVTGCPFSSRCEYAVDYCSQEPIRLAETSPGHSTACLRVQKENLTV